MTEPNRYQIQKINEKLFEDFFKHCGDYNSKELISKASPIWTKCYENHDSNVFESLESKNVRELKELYENYYINGISDGATSGKALIDDKKRQSKSERNLLRSKPLSVHLEYTKQNEDLNLTEFYNHLYKRFNIPKTINIGQTWGWEIGDNFVHFEIQDYLYFLDIIQKILESYGINKTFFIGDGSGVLSSLVYENCNIKSSTHIDIAHLLLRQYINNVESSTKVKHIYAENFDEDMKHDTQILINQDSFPEMPLDSMEKYMRNMDNNNVPFVLSYNIENGITFNPHHIDYRKVILDLGYESIWRFDSAVRPPYVFELFYKGDNDVSNG